MPAPSARGSGSSPAAPSSPASGPPPLCEVDDARLQEASGLVALPGGRLVSHSDSGNEPRLVVLDQGCSVQAATLVVDASTGEPVEGRDPEDLALAPVPGAGGSLWWADTGDNRAVRPDVALVRVDVDDLLAADGTVPGDVVTLRLEGGPADVEAVVVSPDGRDVALVEKTLLLGRARVWVAGLPAPRSGDGGRPASDPVPARVAVELELPASARGPAARAVTGGALLDTDGRGPAVVLRTYTSAWLWALPQEGPWDQRVARAFRSRPQEVPLPLTPQGEAVAVSADGDALVTISEGRPAPVHAVGLPDDGPASQRPSPEVTGAVAQGAVDPGSSLGGPPWLAAGAGVLVLGAVGAAAGARRRGRAGGRV